MVDYIALILLVVTSFAGFFVGIRIVRFKKKWLWIISSVLCIGTIVLYSFLQYHPAIEFKMVPLEISPFFEIINFIPFASVFLGIAQEAVENKNSRRALKMFFIFVVLLGISQSNYLFIGTGIESNRTEINNEGICIQSTPYTCGAAAAVTFLRYYGIFATESEMARLSRTRRGLGVRMASLAYAIEKKMREKNLKIDLIETDFESLKNLRMPCIVDVGLTFLISHVVVLLKVDDEEVEIGDPLGGIVKWKKKRFTDKWHGAVIVVR